MFKFRSFFPEVSPDENPFLRWALGRRLETAGFAKPEITPFDWLHPATSPSFIKRVNKLGTLLEKCPAIRELAGSLLIKAIKPV